MNTLDDIIEFPATDCLDDGDVFIDTTTGGIYTLHNGGWEPANVAVTEQARATFARHHRGAALNFIRKGVWS